MSSKRCLGQFEEDSGEVGSGVYLCPNSNTKCRARSWARNYAERTEAGRKIVYKSSTIRQSGRPAVAPSPMEAATRNLTIDVDSNMCNTV